jgi:hypothetical protein
MKLQAGKRYKRRDGDITGPLAFVSKELFYDEVNDAFYDKCEAPMASGSDLDLIEEYPEPEYEYKYGLMGSEAIDLNRKNEGWEFILDADRNKWFKYPPTVLYKARRPKPPEIKVGDICRVWDGPSDSKSLILEEITGITGTPYPYCTGSVYRQHARLATPDEIKVYQSAMEEME